VLLSQGKELFNNYGSTKPNEELLLGYGFLLPDNLHDSFLVSISSRPTAAAAAADTASQATSSCKKQTTLEGPEAESACDESAVWHQRLAVIAAAGLQLEVAISEQQPLPKQLLDVMLLAVAVPGWQLPQLLAVMQTQQQGEEQTHENKLEVYAAASSGQKLAVLQQLKQQLSSKLRGMLPEAQLQQILQQQQQQQHARLAAGYVLSQQRALKAALAAVDDAAAALLAASIAPGVSGNNCAEQQQQQQQQVALPGLTGAQLGLGVSWCGSCRVVSTGKTLKPGSMLLQMPLEACLVGSSEEQLVLLLMLAAVGLLQQQQQQQQGAAAYFRESWQQQQQQQQQRQQRQFLPWWLMEEHEEFVGLLQGMHLLLHCCFVACSCKAVPKLCMQQVFFKC
jgi:hypothetical protein